MDCDIFNPTKDKPTNIVPDCVAFFDICKIHLSMWSPIDLHLRLGLYTVLVNPKVCSEMESNGGKNPDFWLEIINGDRFNWRLYSSVVMRS